MREVTRPNPALPAAGSPSPGVCVCVCVRARRGCGEGFRDFAPTGQDGRSTKEARGGTGLRLPMKRKRWRGPQGRGGREGLGLLGCASVDLEAENGPWLKP